jgi:hypothetical protein
MWSIMCLPSEGAGAAVNEEKIKELLSQSFLTIIGNRGGFQCQKPSEDYGVDLRISRVEAIVENGKTRYLQTAESIDFQLKCTTAASVEWDVDTSCWKYDLQVKNYNDLVHRRDDIPPLYLLLYVLPTDGDEWLRSSAAFDQLILSGTGYWFLPPVGGAKSDNEYTTRIYIPSAQTVGVGFFQSLFTQIYA